jgi:hypothetical protein
LTVPTGHRWGMELGSVSLCKPLDIHTVTKLDSDIFLPMYPVKQCMTVYLYIFFCESIFCVFLSKIPWNYSVTLGAILEKIGMPVLALFLLFWNL